MNPSSAPPSGHERMNVRAHFALLTLTLALMVVGAWTRAAGAGISCPDWPLCHGHLVPPLDATAYPADPRYAPFKVYLEFVHRIIAATVTIVVGTLAYGLIRRRHVKTAVALLVVLAAQITMGAVTVLLRNAPFTVVIHLGLALTFVAVVITSLRIVRPAQPSGIAAPARWMLLALGVAQLFLGGVVSSRSIGLACYDFPLCHGSVFPLAWTWPIAWQFAHRAVGFALAGALLCFAVAVFRRASPRGERRGAGLLAAGIMAQILLGASNVWFAIPPPVSAAHLGVAAVIFALLFDEAWRPIRPRGEP